MFCIPLYLQQEAAEGLLDDVMAALMAVVNSAESLSPVARREIGSSDEGAERGIVLVTQYYRAISGDPTLQRDIDTVLARNLANPLISRVVLLTEELLELPGDGWH